MHLSKTLIISIEELASITEFEMQLLYIVQIFNFY